MKYGIASYGRPECRTINTLISAGIDKNDITVSVQNERDYEEYSKRHDVRIIYAPNDCAAGNRNNLLKNIGGDLCLLDDDISAFAYWNGEKYISDTQKALQSITASLDGNMDNASIAGIAASGNGLVRKGRPNISYLTLLQGTFLVVMDRSLFFNERWKMVEDYEISLRAIHKGKTTIRFNDYVAIKPKNGSNKGGLHDRYIRGELPLWISRLAKAYPEFRPNKAKTGGQIRL